MAALMKPCLISAQTREQIAEEIDQNKGNLRLDEEGHHPHTRRKKLLYCRQLSLRVQGDMRQESWIK